MTTTTAQYEVRPVKVERLINGRYRDTTRYAVFHGERQMTEPYACCADALIKAKQCNDWYADTTAHDAPDDAAPCLTCGEPVPETGDYCHDCAQESVPEEVKAMKPCRTCRVCGDINVMRETDVCVSCHRTLYPGVLDRAANAAARRLSLMALALLLALLTTHTARATPYTPTAPVGCTVTMFSRDDLSATAVCAGSYLLSKEDGPVDDWDTIFVIDTITVGPDAQGNYHDWPVYE